MLMFRYDTCLETPFRIFNNDFLLSIPQLKLSSHQTKLYFSKNSPIQVNLSSFNFSLEVLKGKNNSVLSFVHFSRIFEVRFNRFNQIEKP